MKIKLQHLFVALTLFASGNVARSATITWTNTAGGDWNTAQNWDLNQVPGSGDSASIPGGSINVTIDFTNSTGGLSLGPNSSLTIASNGVLNIGGSIFVAGALANAGTVNWTGGDIELETCGVAGSIVNLAGGQWNILCDQSLTYDSQCGAGNAYFQNAGVVQKSASLNTTSVQIAFDNSGTVQAESGTIQFNGGSDLGGTFQADASAAIYFGGGSMMLSSPPNFQGPGPVQITGGTFTLVNFVGIFDLEGPTLVGQSTVAAGGTLNWNSGTLNSGSSLTIASNGVLNIAGSIFVVGALANAGTVNWTGGDIELETCGVAGSIVNLAGGQWNILCDQSLTYDSQCGAGNAYFQNAGVVQKSASLNTTSVQIAFDNSGTVQAESGTIQFNGGSDLGGTFQADASAAIYFGGGSMMLSSPPNFQGPGPVQITGGTFTLVNFVGIFDLEGPTLVGQSTVAAGGTLNWNSGTLNSGSSLTIASNGVLNIAGSIFVVGALANAGTVNWTGGDIELETCGAGGSIVNLAGGQWNILCDQSLTYDSQCGAGNAYFQNAGVVQKSASLNTTSVQIAFDNSGTVQAESGTIQFNGGYTENSLASQVIGIGGTAPGSGYGKISFSNPTFAGSFNVTLLNGFRPSPGNSFSVLSYPSVTGDFTSVDGLDLGNGLKLVPQFGNTGLILLATTYPISAKPSLSLYNTPNDVLVFWPLDFTSWQLQSTTNLSTHVWTSVPVLGTNNNIVLPRQGSQCFFRLKTN